MIPIYMHVCILNETFHEGFFYIFFLTFGPTYLKYLDRHDDLLNKKTF